MKKIIIAILLAFTVVAAAYAASNMGLGLNQLSMKPILSEPVAAGSYLVTTGGDNLATVGGDQFVTP